MAQLRHSIEQRIDDLENFYYENDMGENEPDTFVERTPTLTISVTTADERAILFEKQRLKLRKVNWVVRF